MAQEDDEEGGVREGELLGLAASAARLREIVAGNEARMRQLDQFVRRLDELLATASLLDRRPQAPAAGPEPMLCDCEPQPEPTRDPVVAAHAAGNGRPPRGGDGGA